MKKQLLVLSAFVLCGGVLASCNNTSADSSDTTTTTTSETDTRFSVNVNAEDGSTITLDNSDAKFDAGEEVKFTVEVTNDLKELTAVMLDDKTLTVDENGAGSFTMPNHAVTLKTLLYTKGDGSLRKVSKLADDFTEPTSKDDVATLLSEGIAVVGTFNSEEKIHNTYSTFSYPYLDLVSRSSRDGNVAIQGNYRKNTSARAACAYFYQAGFYDDEHFYDIQTTNDGGVTVNSLTFNPHVYNVVDEESTSSDYEITKADAKTKSSSAGFLDDILSKVVNDRNIWNSTEGFMTVTTDISSDKTYFTTKLSSIYPASYSSGSVKVTEISLTVDGDHFVSKVDFTYQEYSMADYNSDEKKINDGATAKVDTGLTYSATRDYKDLVEMPFDIEDFVMNDYDVELFLYSSPYTEVTDATVVGNSTYKYNVISHDNPSLNTIKPRVVGATDDFVSVDTSNAVFTVEKVGKFNLQFDNGLGKVKEVSLTATQPKGTSVTFSKAEGESIFANEENELKVTVTPTLAVQDATLEVDSSKTGGVNATVTKKSDGVFSVKPADVGTVYLKATGIDGSVTKSLSLKSVTKPSLDKLKEALSTHTLKGASQNYYSYFFINFNADGTGTFFNSDNSSGSPIDMQDDFTWTVDEDTLEFTIVYPEKTGRNWIKLVSVSYESAESMFVSSIYCYYGSEKAKSQSFNFIDRKTLS